MADSSRKGDILKVRLADDVRRMVLYNTHISYDDLVLMLQRVYGGKLKSSDDVALKYYDEGEARCLDMRSTLWAYRVFGVTVFMFLLSVSCVCGWLRR